ncbi:MAG TPA: acetyl-CoA C-acetyltransferase [Acidobacteriota bacterium]|nr:acetyl-CoA C-acetyltransferase [Acidobacteriota bacterium]
MKDVFILGGARTPMAEYAGVFNDLSDSDLGSLSAKAAFERSGVAADEIDHTIIGNAIQTSKGAIYGARHVALKAGIPVDRPALTVNRLCGSGIQSIISGAQLIQLEEAGTVLAGGMESMSQAPHVIRGARTGFRLGDSNLEDLLMSSLYDGFCGLFMAQTAEKLARQNDIGREAQDAFALVSQQRAAAAYAAGRLQEEIVPVEVKTRKGTLLVEKDDHMRADTTLEGLAKLRPAFGKDGMVTGGNASGIVDGGAALVLAGEAYVKAKDKQPLARIVGWSVAGVSPDIMGIGPVPAIEKLLQKTGKTLAEIDLVEVNEAFAAQYLAVEKALGLDREKTNVNGGAIALGHPLGASGTRLVLTLMHELRRRGQKLGIASACIGGGQGIAIMIEIV